MTDLSEKGLAELERRGKSIDRRGVFVGPVPVGGVDSYTLIRRDIAWYAPSVPLKEPAERRTQTESANSEDTSRKNQEQNEE